MEQRSRSEDYRLSNDLGMDAFLNDLLTNTNFFFFVNPSKRQ